MLQVGTWCSICQLGILGLFFFLSDYKFTPLCCTDPHTIFWSPFCLLKNYSKSFCHSSSGWKSLFITCRIVSLMTQSELMSQLGKTSVSTNVRIETVMVANMACRKPILTTIQWNGKCKPFRKNCSMLLCLLSCKWSTNNKQHSPDKL
jgi:hypothetical protein